MAECGELGIKGLFSLEALRELLILQQTNIPSLTASLLQTTDASGREPRRT